MNGKKQKLFTIYCTSLVGSFPEETCEIHTDKCNWGLLSNHMHCFLLCFNQDLKHNGFAAKLLRMLIHSGHIDSGHQTKLGQCQIAYYHRLIKVFVILQCCVQFHDQSGMFFQAIYLHLRYGATSLYFLNMSFKFLLHIKKCKKAKKFSFLLLQFWLLTILYWV